MYGSLHPLLVLYQFELYLYSNTDRHEISHMTNPDAVRRAVL